MKKQKTKNKNINQYKTFWFLSKFPITIPFNINNENRAITSYKKKQTKLSLALEIL